MCYRILRIKILCRNRKNSRKVKKMVRKSYIKMATIIFFIVNFIFVIFLILFNFYFNYRFRLQNHMFQIHPSFPFRIKKRAFLSYLICIIYICIYINVVYVKNGRFDLTILKNFRMWNFCQILYTALLLI